MSIAAKLAAVGPINKVGKRVIDRLPHSLRAMLLNAIHNGIVQGQPFSGVYASFDEVETVPRSPESVEAFVKSGLSIKRDDATGLVVLRNGHSLLPLAVGLAKSDKPLRILDFGGSGGIDYLLLKETVSAEIEYHIVEMPAVCAIGRKLWPNEISFTEQLPKEGTFDIVYSWGAVHCVPDPLELLVRFTAYKPQMILIVHSPFGPRAFVRAQVHDGIRIPHWVISLPDAERLMRENGYRLAMRATNDLAYNVDNYDPEHRISHYANLLFVRSR